MQLGNFINVFLARHVSGTYVHHQEHQTLSRSIWFSAPSFWMSGGLESRCVGRAYGAEPQFGSLRHTPTLHRWVSPQNPLNNLIKPNEDRLRATAFRRPNWFTVISYSALKTQGADVAVRHPHRTHDLRSGSQDHHPSKNSVQKTICLQLNVWCSWWWAYVPETCRVKNTLIKLPCCIKLAFQIISERKESVITVYIQHSSDTVI